MKTIKLNDMLGLGLLLISIFIFNLALNYPNNMIKIIGLSGSTILIIIEVVFLFQTWLKN